MLGELWVLRPAARAAAAAAQAAAVAADTVAAAFFPSAALASATLASPFAAASFSTADLLKVRGTVRGGVQEGLPEELPRVPRVVRRLHTDRALRGRHDWPIRGRPEEANVLRRGRCQVGPAVPGELRRMPVRGWKAGPSDKCSECPVKC